MSVDHPWRDRFPEDPFDAAAWWNVHLGCRRCGTMLEFMPDTENQNDADYWHEYGQRAKTLGWKVTLESESHWLILCPSCAKD
jgi:hypothetical protein